MICNSVTLSPKDQHKGTNFQPVEKELVFDIDMTDYDEVRTCCSGADICCKCWKFMAIACKVVDAALRLDFGYKHILWVFSGRRGIHCWVCDPGARSLGAYERGAVAEYLQIIDGGEYMKKKVNLAGEKIHHSIKRALEIIEPVFVPLCVEEQNILGTDEGIEKFVNVLSDEEDRRELKALFGQCKFSKDRWSVFVKYIKSKKFKKVQHCIFYRNSNGYEKRLSMFNADFQGDKKWYQYRYLIEEIMIQYAYPRLDINVSKGMNHLLKSPFCIHPKTGKVCIPLTANTVDKFQPEKVPTIKTLVEEINEFDAKNKAKEEEAYEQTAKRIKDYRKTSLSKSLRVFQEFLWNMEIERKGQRIKESDEKMEF
ncbi:DNA primase small subunit isoform X2 [Andrena cerasifolii]|uniref:DNA primase small subunit isoform X2 n=1 Tax=Andrena cerasifolii TaxID=2819439 RepID=UPI0040377752